MQTKNSTEMSFESGSENKIKEFPGFIVIKSL